MKHFFMKIGRCADYRIAYFIKCSIENAAYMRFYQCQFDKCAAKTKALLEQCKFFPWKTPWSILVSSLGAFLPQIRQMRQWYFRSALFFVVRMFYLIISKIISDRHCNVQFCRHWFAQWGRSSSETGKKIKNIWSFTARVPNLQKSQKGYWISRGGSISFSECWLHSTWWECGFYAVLWFFWTAFFPLRGCFLDLQNWFFSIQSKKNITDQTYMCEGKFKQTCWQNTWEFT